MSEKTGDIFRLIPQVMKAVGAIEKGRRNQQQGYQFRGIDDVYNAMQQPLADAGIFCVPAVVDRHRDERPTRDGKGVLIYTTLTVKHTFYAADGSSVEAVTVGEAMDSGDKSSNKAMSAAMKYALLEVFCIPTADPKDTENDSPQPRHQPRRDPPPPKPADANGDDFLAGNDQFVVSVQEAFDNAGFTDAAREAVLVKVLKAKRKERVIDLDLGDRHGFIAAIGAGKFDQYKQAKTGAA